MWSNGRSSSDKVFIPYYAFRSNDLARFRVGLRIAGLVGSAFTLHRAYVTADTQEALDSATPSILGTSFTASDGDHFETAYHDVVGDLMAQQFTRLGLLAWSTGSARDMAQVTAMFDFVPNS